MKKIEINLTENGHQQLEKLKKDRDYISISDTIRRSLKILRMITDEELKGNEMAIYDSKKNKFTRIVIR